MNRYQRTTPLGIIENTIEACSLKLSVVQKIRAGQSGVGRDCQVNTVSLQPGYGAKAGGMRLPLLAFSKARASASVILAVPVTRPASSSALQGSTVRVVATTADGSAARVA